MAHITAKNAYKMCIRDRIYIYQGFPCFYNGTSYKLKFDIKIYILFIRYDKIYNIILY